MLAPGSRLFVRGGRTNIRTAVALGSRLEKNRDRPLRSFRLALSGSQRRSGQQNGVLATESMGEITGQSPESAVSRAFSVLELLAREAEPVRLTTIAAKLEMQKSTAHRILATLMGLEYAKQDPNTGCYYATLRLWELGAGLIAHHPLKRAAASYMQRLYESTRETVSLVILSGDDVLFLDKVAGPGSFGSRVGSRAPALLAAGGKAILAFDPDARAIIRRTRERLKEARSVPVEPLLKDLQEIRRCGYAVSSFPPGATTFAAPIMGRDGRVIAAMTVAVPERRLTKAGRERTVDELLGTCAELTDQM